MPKKSQKKYSKSRKGGISEAAAVGGAMVGGGIGAVISAAITTGEFKKQLGKLLSPSGKNKKRNST